MNIVTETVAIFILNVGMTSALSIHPPHYSETEVPRPSSSLYWTVLPPSIKTGLNPTKHISIRCDFVSFGGIKGIRLFKRCGDEENMSDSPFAKLDESDNGTVVVDEYNAPTNAVYTGSLGGKNGKFILMELDGPTAFDACLYACQVLHEKNYATFWDYVYVPEVSTSIDELVTAVKMLEFEFAGGSRPIEVRLVGGDDREGAVEVSRYTEFGNPDSLETGFLCDDEFDDNNNGATVVCRMLGWSQGKYVDGNRFTRGLNDSSIIMDNVQCNGDEVSIDKCFIGATWGFHNCDPKSEVAGVRCKGRVREA